MYKEEIYKQAKSKAQKMIDTGKLSVQSIDRLFQESPIRKNLHNAINAKAKRQASNLWPKSKMTAKKYLGISNPDNLASRAPVDTRRIMKYYGNENRKTISELRRQVGDKQNVQVNHNLSRDMFSNVGTSVNFSESGTPKKYRIDLPSKRAERLNPIDSGSAGLTPKELKEVRATLARHEMGEAVA